MGETLGASPQVSFHPDSYLGHGLGGRGGGQHGRGGGVQRLEERRGDDGGVGNVDDGGGDVGARGVHRAVRHGGDGRHLLSGRQARQERWARRETQFPLKSDPLKGRKTLLGSQTPAPCDANVPAALDAPFLWLFLATGTTISCSSGGI